MDAAPGGGETGSPVHPDCGSAAAAPTAQQSERAEGCRTTAVPDDILVRCRHGERLHRPAHQLPRTEPGLPGLVRAQTGRREVDHGQAYDGTDVASPLARPSPIDAAEP